MRIRFFKILFFTLGVALLTSKVFADAGPICKGGGAIGRLHPLFPNFSCEQVSDNSTLDFFNSSTSTTAMWVDYGGCTVPSNPSEPNWIEIGSGTLGIDLENGVRI